MTTGPRVGSSSVAWETPAGLMTSMAFGTAPGGNVQMAAVPPGAHTPNRNGWGVGAKPRAWSGLKPSWPVSTTVKIQPVVGWPSAALGTMIVMNREIALADTLTGPSDAPLASTNTGDAKPCTSSRLLHAEAGAIV